MATDIAALIQASRDRADATATAANQVAASALGNFYIPGGTEYKATTPKLRGTPPAYTGNMNIVPDIKAAFAEAFAEFKPEMTEALADYIGRFWPECVTTHTDNWICNTILYGGTGIPAEIENAIWERARSRELLDAQRVEREAFTSFANRGFSMPGGFVANEVMRAQQGAADKTSTLVRERAIKSAEIEIENIKFAVQQGVAIRSTVIGAVGTYLKAYLTPIDQALDKAKLIADAQQKLWSSTADYYRAMVSEAQLDLSAQEINARSHDALQANQNNALLAFTQTRMSATTAVAQVLAQLAAGASSAAVTLVGDETSLFKSGTA